MSDHGDRAIKRELVIALLANYPQARLEDSARATMLEQWVDDLDQFRPHVVKQACDKWRQEELRRPMVPQIIALARKIAAPAGTSTSGARRGTAPAFKWVKGPGGMRKAAVEPGETRPVERDWFNEIPVNDELVRPNWRDIPVRALTRAEYAEHEATMDADHPGWRATARRAFSEAAAAAKDGRRAIPHAERFPGLAVALAAKRGAIEGPSAADDFEMNQESP